MLLVYAILVVLMFVCGYWLHCKSSLREGFDTTDGAGPTEIDIIRIYAKVLQRQPTAQELSDALTKKLTLDDLEGRLMDTDEYLRIIKVQSNSLTPELDRIIHEKKQLAYLADVYFAERTANIPASLLMPLRDILIYLEYEEAAFRLFLQDAKYPDFEKKLLNAFQLSKEKTLQMFDDMFNKKDLLARAKDMKQSAKPSEVRDPPTLVRTYEAAPTDAKPTGTVEKAIVASKSTEVAVVPGKPKEGFVNYVNAALAPMGVAVESQVSRTIDDRDSDMQPMLYDVEQRSKNIFDIHRVAKKLDDTPDAFVYVPVIPVRYEKPITHHTSKPPGNNDPFASDLFGCYRGAPVSI